MNTSGSGDSRAVTARDGVGITLAGEIKGPGRGGRVCTQDQTLVMSTGYPRVLDSALIYRK
jgi:hypothetical protein